MKKRWLGYVLFIPLFTAALIFLAELFPHNNRIDNFFNRILPLKGHLLGQEPEAWIGDVLGQTIAGKGKENRPPSMDVDFVKVKGKWYKVKGPVYITQNGKMIGWHIQTTLEETGYLGKWSYVE